MMTLLDQLESDAQTQRARFAEEIEGIRLSLEESADKLRADLSPARIIRRSSEKWRSAVVRSARENPIQAGSAAALLAYPAWRLARALPLPIVVAGLGVFFGSKMSSSSAPLGRALSENNRRAAEAIERVIDAGSQLRETATDGLKKFEAQAGNRVNAASAAIQNVGHSAAESASSRLAHVSDTASEVLSNAVKAIRPSEDTLQSIKDGTQAAAQSAAGLGRRAVASSVSYSHDTVAAATQNPILVAGLGLAVGSLLAAMLPDTKAGAERDSAPGFKKPGEAKTQTRNRPCTDLGGQS